jgi:hypothetical protein
VLGVKNMSRKLSQRWYKLLCRLRGHEFVDGLKFTNAKGQQGYAKVCYRCGLYHNVITDNEQPMPPTI